MESHFPNLPATHQSQLARERVLDDVRALVTDGELLLKATADDLSRAAVDARQRLAAMIARAKVFIADFQEQSAESARAAVNKAESTVREHPFAAVAAALGTGICVGMLWQAHRSRTRARNLA